MSTLTLKDREKLLAEYASLGKEMEMDELFKSPLIHTIPNTVVCSIVVLYLLYSFLIKNEINMHSSSNLDK